MNRQDQIDLIIKEYRDRRAELRKTIQDCEHEELSCFGEMCKRIEALQDNYADEVTLHSKYSRTLVEEPQAEV